MKAYTCKCYLLLCTWWFVSSQ